MLIVLESLLSLSCLMGAGYVAEAIAVQRACLCRVSLSHSSCLVGRAAMTLTLFSINLLQSSPLPESS